ncbi:unnamed protein product [Pocillopora meandrina]|uniref:Uncharacterized protein n=1 Tax=Pocillopora meandrina TaxID=46732 RepID=A0AAU9Y5X8_9CNID|nr:unnamed protein product [Pocillopora meandrina]
MCGDVQANPGPCRNSTGRPYSDNHQTSENILGCILLNARSICNKLNEFHDLAVNDCVPKIEIIVLHGLMLKFLKLLERKRDLESGPKSDPPNITEQYFDCIVRNSNHLLNGIISNISKASINEHMSMYVFNIKLVPGIMLSTMGFVVSLPDSWIPGSDRYYVKKPAQNYHVSWIKRLGSWVAALTEMGVVTEVVVEMMLTIADLWNFTEGTFTVDSPLGCASDKMGMKLPCMFLDKRQPSIWFLSHIQGEYERSERKGSVPRFGLNWNEPRLPDDIDTLIKQDHHNWCQVLVALYNSLKKSKKDDGPFDKMVFNRGP